MDANLVECAFDNPLLMPVLLSTFLTHPEYTEDAIGLYGLKILHDTVVVVLSAYLSNT